jgi:hypothetical protein
MIGQKSGEIINILSIGGKHGYPSRTAYCASMLNISENDTGGILDPANLLEKIIGEIRRGKRTNREGALELTCHCHVYKPVRAERLLRMLVRSHDPRCPG